MIGCISALLRSDWRANNARPQRASVFLARRSLGESGESAARHEREVETPFIDLDWQAERLPYSPE